MYFAIVSSENVISSDSQIGSSRVNYSIDHGQDRCVSNQCTFTPDPLGRSNGSSLLKDELKALESFKSTAEKEVTVNTVTENETSQGGGRHDGSGSNNWEATAERYNTLPKGGADMTLSELQEMAARQQQQIESQQHILVAKEQHLKYLKQQEQKQQQLVSESEQLRKLRDRVEAQELKLKKLRALRGQVEQQKASNGNLNYELESIKALFNEKEKELSIAVLKVEEMTRQLEEIRSGRVKSSTNTQSPAALAELEKLKKELMIRNKLNEQQNMKMASTRELLLQRKDELARMDNRIHELQARLKKKKSMGAEMSEKNRNQFNKPILNNNILNHPFTNVASIEPYEQEINTNNVSSGCAKLNPIYQSLPNSKISYSDKVNLSRETNNNNGTYQAKQYNDSRSDEYSIPLVIAVDNANRPSHNGLPPSSKQSPVNPHQGTIPYPMPNTLQIPKSQPSSNVNHSRFGTAVPVKTGISHFAPKPYGSMYSSAMLTNRGTGGVPNDLVHLNSQDDVRQAGSGQSSPRSIDSLNGSPKPNPLLTPSTVKGQQVSRGPEMETSPIGRLPIELQSKVPPPIPNRTTLSSDIIQSNVSIPVPSMSTTTANGSNSQENSSNMEQTNITVSKSIPKFSVFGNQPHKDENKTGGASLNSGGFSNLNHASALGAVRPAPTYRYASKSVIANTYFGKLGGENLEKYQKSVLSLHRDLNISSKSELTSKSEANKHVEKIREDEKESFSPAANQNLPVNSSPSPASPSRLSTDPFDFPSIPPHADVASDKVSYKPNTPKNIRRRHSDSDNEEVTKALHKYGINANVNKNSLVIENELLALVNNPGTVEMHTTAFNNNHIPETVLLDNKGNFVEVLDNNIEDVHNIEDVNNTDVADNVKLPSVTIEVKSSEPIMKKKTNLKTGSSRQSNNRVTFDPLALLLDASLEGELDLVRRCAHQVENVSASNDEGITALHNAICAGHYDIVTFLVEFGCDVNSPDSDGWAPLHCAASCNNLPMVKFLVEHGACIFATTISDHETAAEKCEEEEDGYEGCTEYLYSIQEKLGIMNNGTVYAVFDYTKQNSDELDLGIGDLLTVLRKGDDKEKEWWWAEKDNQEGYIPRNLLGLTPRVLPKAQPEGEV